MENASKALLIAGAILIVILLIGVGMLVYNSSMGSIDEAVAQMSTQEKTMFNSQFTQYEGKMSGSSVKALINKVNTNNAGKTAGSAKYVAIDNASGCVTSASTVISAKMYTVTLTKDSNTGLVNKVTIK